MLTRELSIADYSSGRIIPDRITQNRHQHYVAFAAQLLTVYRNGFGRTRSDLHRSVHAVFADELECPLRRVDAFCKLLDEKSTYDRDRNGAAASLRRQVFRLAGQRHPLVEQPDQLFEKGETAVKQEIAKKLGLDWREIETKLFADVIQFHRLSGFEGYETPQILLARYNVAQCQAVLYDAISMTVWAGDDFKAILRYAKLARLMHTIERLADGTYVFQFDGPASVLRRSRRYGVAMARFLPSLLACRDWRMQANIRHRRSNWQNVFRLSPKDGLNTNVAAPDDFDSKLEEDFAARWGSDPREGWTLIREGEILHVGQKAFVPDFVFEHERGTRVMLEIVGFWTPEYLAAKIKTVELFSDRKILLAISETLSWPDNNRPDSTKASLIEILRFKSSIRVNDILAKLPDV